MKKSYVIVPVTIATFVLAGGAVLFATSVQAAEEDNNDLPPLMDVLVNKFHLDRDEVMAAVEEERKERQEERLSELVEEGKITEAQKEAIIKMHEEMHAKIEQIRESDTSATEKRKAIRELHEDMREWMEEQGIDLKEIKKDMHQGRGRGLGRGKFMGVGLDEEI